MFLHQANHGEREERRDQSRAALNHIAAVDNRAHD